MGKFNKMNGDSNKEKIKKKNLKKGKNTTKGIRINKQI